MASQALINYYARILRKDQIDEKDIPDDIIDDVKEAMSKLPDQNLSIEVKE